MAQEIVGFKIVIDGQEKVVSSIGEMKKLLKEANFELLKAQQNFGEYSDEAVNAAKKVATLKDTIQEAKETSDLFDPGKKFQAFAGAISAVAGGFSAVQGALGLVGVKSDEVEKTLLKVQSALALSQGLSTIADAAKDFQRLNAIIQQTTIFQRANNLVTIAATAIQRAFGASVVGTGRAFTILKGAIAATGIGLLIVGISTLVSKIIDWTNSSEKAAEAQKKLAAQTELINAKIGNQISVLTALGGKEKEIYELKLQQTRNELSVLETAEKKKIKLTDEEIKRKGDLTTQLQVLAIEENKRLAKIDEDAKKKQEEKDKEASEKLKANVQERINANKDANEQIKKLRQEAELNAINDQNKRAIRQAEIDFENRKIEIEALKASEKLKTELLLEEQKKRDEAIKNLKEEANQAELTAIIERLDREKEADARELKRIEDQNQAEFDLIFENLERQNEAERLAAIAQKQIEKEKTDFKKDQLEEVKQALIKLGEIVGKETAAGKALGIATALINTYQGATEALKQKSTLPSPFDFAAKAINVAAIISSGIKSVKAIAAVKVPGGGSASIPSASISTSGGSAPIIPPTQQAQLTQLDQGTINRLGSATNRAYVVESDITNSQERIRRINRAARLN